MEDCRRDQVRLSDALYMYFGVFTLLIEKFETS